MAQMNEPLLLKMAAPYVKNGILTYELFDRIFSILQLQEQYQVVEILFKNGIRLEDKFPEESPLNADEESPDISLKVKAEIDDDDEGLWDSPSELDDSIFKDVKEQFYPNSSHSVKQSNETLAILCQEGNPQAIQDICIKNTGLVITISKRYYHLALKYNLEFEDLMQYGYIGLLEAAKRFDITRDSRFTTYAPFWIFQSIDRAVSDAGPRIRIPIHMVETIRSISRLDKELEMAGLDYNQRMESIAAKLDIPLAKVLDCMRIKYQFLSHVSLNTPAGEEEETEIIELIEDPHQIRPEDEVFSEELRKDMDSVLETLTERERDVIRMRFGLLDGNPHTLEAVGELFGVTRERIRQIENKAIRKLRHPTRAKRLRDWYSGK